MRNQRGALTLDFIFALVLVLSMTMLLGVFSYALSTIESIQYLAFSASRAYFAADSSYDKQRTAGQNQFATLSKQSAYKNFLKKGWMDVTLNDVGDYTSIYGVTSAKDVLDGVQLKVDAQILNMNIPIFGSTTRDESYTAFITSFIGHEPSAEECMSVISQRFNQILKLGNYSSSNVNAGSYVAIDDNGC